MTILVALVVSCPPMQPMHVKGRNATWRDCCFAIPPRATESEASPGAPASPETGKGSRLWQLPLMWAPQQQCRGGLRTPMQKVLEEAGKAAGISLQLNAFVRMECGEGIEKCVPAQNSHQALFFALSQGGLHGSKDLLLGETSGLLSREVTDFAAEVAEQVKAN
ncbi:hypothetical protein CYMTET_36620 [Cymbomonas tetramitiformis]|uniref:Uncharacterized protein n=1 Tax=Cymbomonas tetramitiformis TaxID=36881 RepID=A0AAE0CH47_9CHLO|nr:hypothetical protein CYMTET_36620 [Cymbomonas tetramitiformis]